MPLQYFSVQDTRLQAKHALSFTGLHCERLLFLPNTKSADVFSCCICELKFTRVEILTSTGCADLRLELYCIGDDFCWTCTAPSKLIDGNCSSLAANEFKALSTVLRASQKPAAAQQLDADGLHGREQPPTQYVLSQRYRHSARCDSRASESHE